MNKFVQDTLRIEYLLSKHHNSRKHHTVLLRVRRA